MIAYLHSSINPYSNFKSSLKNLLKDFNEIDLTQMDFPKNWLDEPLWKG
jgi:hypothetical protein